LHPKQQSLPMPASFMVSSNLQLEFKICRAVNKEEAATDYFTLFLAKIRLHRILALLPQGVWAKIGSYQILAGGKHKWAISSVIWKAKFWRSQKNMPAF
jgi:hypothetical protein